MFRKSDTWRDRKDVGDEEKKDALAVLYSLEGEIIRVWPILKYLLDHDRIGPATPLVE